MPDPIDAIIVELEWVQKRPGMYLGRDFLTIQAWLSGFNSACAALGYRAPHAIYEEVVGKRGWEHSTINVFEQMSEQGYEPLAIVDELLTIEIECWQRTRNP